MYLKTKLLTSEILFSNKANCQNRVYTQYSAYGILYTNQIGKPSVSELTFFCVSYSVFLILSSTLCPFFIHCSTFSPFLSVSFSQCSVFHFLFINSSTGFFPFLRFSFSFISRMYSLSLVSPVFLVARSNFLSTVVCYLPFSLFIFLLCTPFPISAFAPLFHSICLPALCFNAGDAMFWDTIPFQTGNQIRVKHPATVDD